jgi:formate dehydrogenase major subunit
MNMELSRRGLLKVAGVGVAATSVTAMGFTEAEAAVAAHVRPFKLVNTTETRNTCTYCSVACGVIMYSRGDVRKGERGEADPRRGRSGSPHEPRHALPQGRGAEGLREVRDAH